jgi:hypothetical protein
MKILRYKWYQILIVNLFLNWDNPYQFWAGWNKSPLCFSAARTRLRQFAWLYWPYTINLGITLELYRELNQIHPEKTLYYENTRLRFKKVVHLTSWEIRPKKICQRLFMSKKLKQILKLFVKIVLFIYLAQTQTRLKFL